MKRILFVTGLLFSIVSCTENSRVKNWGGEATIELPKGQKLIEVTWKENNIWYLTREMREDENSETYKFHEESSFGVMEGTYVINENK